MTLPKLPLRWLLAPLLTAVIFFAAGMIFGFPFHDLRLPALIFAVLLGAAALLLAARLIAALKNAAGLWIAAAAVLLAGMLVPGIPAGGPFGSFGETALAYLLAPCLAIPVAAMLFACGLPGVAVSPARPYRPTGLQTLTLVSATALLAAALVKFYWLLIWDSTYDPLGWLWLAFPILAALFAGIVLSMAAPARPWLAGLGYALIVPLLLVAVSAAAGQVDFRQLTEQRAARVAQAVEAYHARTGGYPQDLRQLVPANLLYIPGPVILHGQGWCYETGSDGYRLAYVTRLHWSDPRLSARVHSQVGDPAAFGPACRDEVAAIQARYPDYPFTYWDGDQ